MANLGTLDLVEPSAKKHSVKGAPKYGSLTRYGKEVCAVIRRRELEANRDARAEGGR